MDASTVTLVRIGELSRRVGVTVDRLRAWESRYDLLRPQRSPGGFRLYTPDDEARVRAMLGNMAAGMSAAEAARAVTAARPVSLPNLKAVLGEACARFDESTAEAILDALFGREDLDSALREVIYPLLRTLGEQWRDGTIDVAQEHFASNLIERRLTAVPASTATGFGRVVLAAPSGEHHVLGLVGLGAGLRRRGVRVTYLGADTPVPMIARTATAVRADAVVVAATMSHVLPAAAGELRTVAEQHRVLLAGPAGSRTGAEPLGVSYMDADPATAAAYLADLIATGDSLTSGA